MHYTSRLNFHRVTNFLKIVTIHFLPKIARKPPNFQNIFAITIWLMKDTSKFVRDSYKM